MVAGESLALGTELKELHFESVADWLVTWNDPATVWQSAPTFMLASVVYTLGGLLTLVHALASGGRWPFLWFATIFHGLIVESLSYFLADVDNFWHSQSPIMLLGRRLPLHIALIYPCFIYIPAVAVSKLRLPGWAAPFAVGLGELLIDLPYDYMGLKFLHWTWHDTDPNINERNFYVPWTSYYFHSTFAFALAFWFYSFRNAESRWQSQGIGKETFNMVLASLLATPLGIATFVVLYHPFHDIYKVHSEVTFFALFTIFVSIVWAGILWRSPASVPGKEEKKKASWRTWLLVVHLVLHYALCTGMAVVGQPEREVSTGLHEQLGDCEAVVPLQTSSGMVLEKHKYLCKTNHDQAYFDFHCLPGGKPPADGAYWYTICGTPFENRAEYLLALLAINVAAFAFFWPSFFRPGPDSASAAKTKPVGLKLKIK